MRRRRFLIKVSLQGLGCFLAWNFRRAQVGHLTLTVFSVAGAPSLLLTSHNPPLHFCLSGVLILCCNVAVLSWTFAPTVSRTR